MLAFQAHHEETLPLHTRLFGDPGDRPKSTSVGEDDGTQKPFHRECFYVTGTRLSLITTSSPLVTVFDWEVVIEERVVPGTRNLGVLGQPSR